MSKIVDDMGRPYNRELHEAMSAINYFHREAHPILPTPEQIAEYKRCRDELIAKLKAQGKRVLLVKADYLEDCGRYVCEGDDGVNGYDPLPGTTTLEEEGLRQLALRYQQVLGSAERYENTLLGQLKLEE